MSPVAMTLIFVVTLSIFGWSASRRWRLLMTGRPEPRFDRLGERLRGTWRFAFRQEKMDYYQPAGIAHKLIFVGLHGPLAAHHHALGARVLSAVQLFVLTPESNLGRTYEFAKDTVASSCSAAVAVFAYYRLLRPLKRITTIGRARSSSGSSPR
jgi:hypothetical protein